MLNGVPFTGWLQRIVARYSYRFHENRTPSREISWVIGPEEIANMVFSIASSIPNSFSAIVEQHTFYENRYDSVGQSPRLPWFAQRLTEAWQFGRLAAWSKGFIYVGASEFLRANRDNRAYEFHFLKERNRGVVCYFTGSDIRSIRVMQTKEAETGIPNIGTYLPQVNPSVLSESYDRQRRRTAETADKFADIIFTAAEDQLGYIKSETTPFIYFIDDNNFASIDEKYDKENALIVVHAPSSPIIKGTPLVRAAVDALRAEGLKFEYIELTNVSNKQVKELLKKAHVVLNEFYASMPGVFGVEAMAAGTVLLTSASREHEPDLPPGSDEAWVVTPHFAVTEKLRWALSAPRHELRTQALQGQAWAREHATFSQSGARLNNHLNQISKSLNSQERLGRVS